MGTQQIEGAGELKHCAGDPSFLVGQRGGAVDSLRRVLGGGKRLEPLGIEDARSVAARVLDTEIIDQGLADGRAMTLEQAVDYAKELKKASKVAS